MRLSGKVAVVTGSTFGIGRETALLFAKEGAKVVVSGRTVEAGEQVVKEIQADGGQAIFFRADVSVARDIRGLIEAAVKTYGKLDVLFNNAGFLAHQGKVADEPEESWDLGIAVNLKGVYLGIKYAVPEMIRNGGGSIISNSSMWGIAASHRSGGSYAASKAGIIGLTKQSALDYAPYKIRINCVLPGDIAFVGATRPKEYWTRPEVVQERSTHQPLPKMGDTRDVAYAVLYLASDESMFVTGSSLVVDGGMTIAEVMAGRTAPS